MVKAQPAAAQARPGAPTDGGRPATPLQRQLAALDSHRPQPLDALRLARHALLEGRKLDMQALAGELGINRVTLYRWVGGREELLVEALWSMTERWFRHTWGELDEWQGPRVPEALRRWIRETTAEPGLRGFLYGESDLAMRLLNLESGGFQPRMAGLLADLIDQDIAEARLEPSLPAPQLAYAALRIAESYIYLPVITGQDTDPDLAFRVLQLLMPGQPTRTTRPPSRKGRRR